jgi:hypothetical protein
MHHRFPTLNKRRVAFWAVFSLLALGIAACRYPFAHIVRTGHLPRTVAGVLQTYGEDARRHFEPECRRQGIVWPPKRLYLLAFKQERSLEVWAGNALGPYKRIGTFPVLAASGRLGPKRREGDMQVPEGFYRLPVLNPTSQFHLSIRVDYPNADDVRNASVPRNKMGGDIYIHGNQVSIGCIALGDPAIEKLFCLAAQVSPSQRRILIAPVDFRVRTTTPPEEPWIQTLYGRLATELRQFKAAE